jgi:hypothetical protein
MIERGRWYHGTYRYCGAGLGERVRFCIAANGSVFIADRSGRNDGKCEHVQPIELDESEPGTLRMQCGVEIPIRDDAVDRSIWWTTIEGIEPE